MLEKSEYQTETVQHKWNLSRELDEDYQKTIGGGPRFLKLELVLWSSNMQ
jgi:hypothetical protein